MARETPRPSLPLSPSLRVCPASLPNRPWPLQVGKGSTGRELRHPHTRRPKLPLALSGPSNTAARGRWPWIPDACPRAPRPALPSSNSMPTDPSPPLSDSHPRCNGVCTWQQYPLNGTHAPLFQGQRSWGQRGQAETPRQRLQGTPKGQASAGGGLRASVSAQLLALG